MPITITHNTLNNCCDQLSHDEFAIEASTLGLRPGEWPAQISATVGNLLPFLRRNFNESGAIYAQSNGSLILRVWND